VDWSLLASILKISVAVALGVPLALYLLQDKLIFHPQVVAQRAPSAADVYLQAADGTRLHALQVKAAPTAPLLQYFGGNAEDVAWMLEEIARCGSAANWLLVDYRGYGASAGRPSEASLSADAIAWYDRVAPGAARVYVLGRSLGSGVAVQLAASRRVDGVILVTPFDSLARVAKRHYPFLPVDLLLRHPFDSLGRAPGLRAPLLCIAATRDEVIPAEHARGLYDAWGGEKHLLELEAGHNDIDNHPDYWGHIGRFLSAG
jgi:fermentation-respiration switch protein FrsA (DUF1100 family)